MIYIFHGDDQAKTRQSLRQLVDQVMAEGTESTTISGDKLTLAELETTLSSASLFGTELLIIENLLSRTRSKEKDECVQLLVNYQGDKSIALWDKKEVTKPNLTKFDKLTPKPKVVFAKTPALLFTFLESLYPGNASHAIELYHQLLTNTANQLIFVMLVRHLNALIQANSATNLKLPPWMAAKLKGQASKWSEPDLVAFHDQLFRIDIQIKSGTTKLDLTSQLDILLLQVLG